MLLWGRRRLLSDRARLGRWGQKRAERFLRRKGFETIARNYAFRGGEIDLVMADGDAVAFVEVKTRRSEDFAPAHAAVNYGKQVKLTRTAKRFLGQYKLSDRPLRFDIITVLLSETGPPEIRHYQNAFRPK